MDNNNFFENNEENRLAQKRQVSYLFTSLKLLALGMIIAGIILVIVFRFMNIDPLTEFLVLLLFGCAGGGYIIARGRSILISYQETIEKNNSNKS